MKKETAYKRGTIREEDGLPIRFVLYPSFYGAFFAFSQSENPSPQDTFLCSCSREAVKTLFQEIYERSNVYLGINKEFLQINKEFPQILTSHLERIISNTQNIPKTEVLLNNLNFYDNLCHVCNRAEPSLAYCSTIYLEDRGDSFDRNYGWYEKQRLYEQGIYCIPLTKPLKRFSGAYFPKDIVKKIDQIKNDLREELMEI